MYGLELAGEQDAFAVYEAKSAAAGVELVAPGLATAGSITDRVETLAYTRRAIELLGRTDADVESARALLRAAPIEREGTVAVRARDVRGSSGISTQRAQRELGSVLVDRGFAVDLEEPDHVLYVLFSSGEVEADEIALGRVPDVVGDSLDVCLVGWLAAESTRDFTERKPTDRPFFQPGSMAPIDARAYVNVAGAGPGRFVVDPMCGTGGLLIEGGLVGARVLGVDVQEKMVRGTKRNLESYLSDSASSTTSVEFGVVRGDATALPLCDSDDTGTQTGTQTDTDTVDAVVFDAPYGRQSKIARHELAELVEGALAEAKRVCRSDGRTVLVADRSWREAAISAGWEVDAVFCRPVHRSLDRYVHVLTGAAEPGRENSP
ncbi:tRNA G10 N-methylase Trm11 [Halalkaliarchaeum sp. AArc-CO]|uniref:TIGR01177 family methyltransferase n=1 Tax=Halalkaliarchaeum sp. AArc-CO TaxID=2866381 RepID=UPI0031F2FA42|nr:tRNA G10 N-methylase Trm11 [Halalkaliarchaeum sp. AArc-CO]